MISKEIQEQEDYPFEGFETEKEKKQKAKAQEFNPACRCPEFKCKRHSNCKECQAHHHKCYETTYCGK